MATFTVIWIRKLFTRFSVRMAYRNNNKICQSISSRKWNM